MQTRCIILQSVVFILIALPVMAEKGGNQLQSVRQSTSQLKPDVIPFLIGPRREAIQKPEQPELQFNPVENIYPPDLEQRARAATETSQQPELRFNPVENIYPLDMEQRAHAATIEHNMGFQSDILFGLLSSDGIAASLHQNALVNLDWMFRPVFLDELQGAAMPVSRERFEQDGIARFPVSTQYYIMRSRSLGEYNWNLANAVRAESVTRSLKNASSPTLNAMVAKIFDPVTVPALLLIILWGIRRHQHLIRDRKSRGIAKADAFSR